MSAPLQTGQRFLFVGFGIGQRAIGCVGLSGIVPQPGDNALTELVPGQGCVDVPISSSHGAIDLVILIGA